MSEQFRELEVVATRARLSTERLLPTMIGRHKEVGEPQMWALAVECDFHQSA